MTNQHMEKLPLMPTDVNGDITKLTWCDIHYAVTKGILSLKTAIEFALIRMDLKDSTDLEIEMAGMTENQLLDAKLLLEKIIANEHCDESASQYRMLRIYLKWIIAKTDLIDVNTYLIDEIYFHFDRPKILEDCLSFSIVNEKNRNLTIKESISNIVFQE